MRAAHCLSHSLVGLSFNSQFVVGNIVKMSFALMFYIAIRQTARQNECAILNWPTIGQMVYGYGHCDDGGRCALV